jgi:hypothetical protein
MIDFPNLILRLNPLDKEDPHGSTILMALVEMIGRMSRRGG